MLYWKLTLKLKLEIYEFVKRPTLLVFWAISWCIMMYICIHTLTFECLPSSSLEYFNSNKLRWFYYFMSKWLGCWFSNGKLFKSFNLYWLIVCWFKTPSCHHYNSKCDYSIDLWYYNCLVWNLLQRILLWLNQLDCSEQEACEFSPLISNKINLEIKCMENR